MKKPRPGAAWEARNPEKVIATALKTQLKKYGLTPEAYNALLQSQNGLCGICRKSDHRGRLSVDHDHSTGRIRGLLCRPCNVGIGNLNDDPALLAAAIRWLK